MRVRSSGRDLLDLRTCMRGHKPSGAGTRVDAGSDVLCAVGVLCILCNCNTELYCDGWITSFLFSPKSTPGHGLGVARVLGALLRGQEGVVQRRSKRGHQLQLRLVGSRSVRRLVGGWAGGGCTARPAREDLTGHPMGQPPTHPAQKCACTRPLNPLDRPGGASIPRPTRIDRMVMPTSRSAFYMYSHV